MQLRSAIEEVQRIGKTYGFTLIIVGGAIVRLIDKKTEITGIDRKRKKITLSQAAHPSTKREEDKDTLVDIDCIAFSDKPVSIHTIHAFINLKKKLQKLQNQYSDFPAVSIEPVLSHPAWKNPHMLTQFNSSIEQKKNGEYFFRLDSVEQKIQENSLDFWHIHFTDNPKDTITTFSPIAIQKRYAIRGLVRKPKDRQKIWNSSSPFFQFVTQFDQETRNEEQPLFIEWDIFEKKIHNTHTVRIEIKRFLTKIFWSSVGPYLAHGKGTVGKLLLPFGNTFFSGK